MREWNPQPIVSSNTVVKRKEILHSEDSVRNDEFELGRVAKGGELLR